MSTPTIRDIKFQGGIAYQENATSPSLLLGLQLSDGTFHWGECLGEFEHAINPKGYSNIREILLERFQGETLLDLLEHNGEMVERELATVQVPIVVTQKKEAAEIRGNVDSEQKRRAFISVLGQTPPKPKKVAVEKFIPLPKPIRYGVSLAMIKAGDAQGLNGRMIPPADFVPGLITPVDVAEDPKLFVLSEVLLLTLPPTPNPTGFGENGELLQRHIGELSQWMIELSEAVGRQTPPKLMLQLNGLYGNLFNNQLGKVLGAFYGINYASKAVELIVVDPVLPLEMEQGIKTYKDLKKLVRSRGIPIELVMGKGCTDLNELRQWIESGFFQRFLFSNRQFSSPFLLSEAIKLCQANSIATILELESETTLTNRAFWLKTGLNWRADWLIPGPSRHHTIDSLNYLIEVGSSFST